MTYLKAIIEELQPYPVRQSLVIRKCEKFKVWHEDTETDEGIIALCAIDILVQMKTLNGVGEGGVDISFVPGEVDGLIKKLCREQNLDHSEYVKEPTVAYLGDL